MELINSVDDIIYSEMKICFGESRIKLSDVDELIIMLLFFNFLLSLKYSNLFLYTFTNAIVNDDLFFSRFVEPHNNVFHLFVSVAFVLAMTPSFMLFKYFLRGKDIFQFFGNAIANIANIMRLFMMSFEVVVIFVVDILEFLAVPIANVAFHMFTYL
jgi:hypothetical protein